MNSAHSHANHPSTPPGEWRGTQFLRGIALVKVTGYQLARDPYTECDLQYHEQENQPTNQPRRGNSPGLLAHLASPARKSPSGEKAESPVAGKQRPPRLTRGNVRPLRTHPSRRCLPPPRPRAGTPGYSRCLPRGSPGLSGVAPHSSPILAWRGMREHAPRRSFPLASSLYAESKLFPQNLAFQAGGDLPPFPLTDAAHSPCPGHQPAPTLV